MDLKKNWIWIVIAIAGIFLIGNQIGLFGIAQPDREGVLTNWDDENLYAYFGQSLSQYCYLNEYMSNGQYNWNDNKDAVIITPGGSTFKISSSVVGRTIIGGSPAIDFRYKVYRNGALLENVESGLNASTRFKLYTDSGQIITYTSSQAILPTTSGIYVEYGINGASSIYSYQTCPYFVFHKINIISPSDFTGTSFPTTGMSGLNGYGIYTDNDVNTARGIQYHSSIKIKGAASCKNDADTNCDGIVDRDELGVQITKWISGTLDRNKLGEYIVAWLG